MIALDMAAAEAAKPAAIAGYNEDSMRPAIERAGFVGQGRRLVVLMIPWLYTLILPKLLRPSGNELNLGIGEGDGVIWGWIGSNLGSMFLGPVLLAFMVATSGKVAKAIMGEG